MKYSICWLIFLLSTIAQAQPDSLWSQCFGERMEDSSCKVIQKDDGGFVVAGSTQPNYDIWDFRLVFTDQAGNSIRIVDYGSDEDEYCLDMIQTKDGNFALAGKIGMYNAEDFLFIIADEMGDSLYSRRYGTEGVRDICQSVIQTDDDGFLLVGDSDAYGNGWGNAWIIRTDSQGDSLWSRNFGGDRREHCFKALQTDDGGFLLLCLTWSFGGQKVWLVKTDSEGFIEWDNTYGGEYLNNGYDIVALPDGRFAIAGDRREPFGGSYDDDFWLFVVEGSGDLVWSKTYGGRNSDYGHSLVYMGNDGFTFGGSTGSFGSGMLDFWLLRTNIRGDSLWSCSFGGRSAEGINDIAATSDGGYILTGNSYTFGPGSSDIWLVKTGRDPLAIYSPDEDFQISTFDLFTPYPNPFNSTTTIRYSLPQTSNITLRVYDISGRMVSQLFNGKQEAGIHSTLVRADTWASGLYFVRLEAGGKVFTHKVMLIR